MRVKKRYEDLPFPLQIIGHRENPGIGRCLKLRTEGANTLAQGRGVSMGTCKTCKDGIDVAQEFFEDVGAPIVLESRT